MRTPSHRLPSNSPPSKPKEQTYLDRISERRARAVSFQTPHGRGTPIVSRNVERDFSDRAHFTWNHLATIRRRWRGQLVVKGILTAEDARLAHQHGVDGIIVSNHGGRQLDGAIAPMRALPEVVEAVPQLPVMLDSGVRRGTDVIKALALGARCVFIGRPFAYAAAVGSCRGVAHGISLMQAEISRDLAMLGITRATDVDAQCIQRPYPN